MGYLDKSEQTVTAHFTRRGRELLAEALSGDRSGKYIITKFALADDEVDYSLYEENLSTNLRGRVIENMPMLETPVNEHEVMNSLISIPTPPVALKTELANIPAQITLQGQGDIIDISPETDNYDGSETYEFVLGHDNLVEMFDVNNPPVSDFMFTVDSQGSPPNGTPPSANFNYNVM
jgi:hypothetical protein|tara:strand:- start:168 stop:701 length:534 start_codon:yes stop_codon:yes gene_type:complete